MGKTGTFGQIWKIIEFSQAKFLTTFNAILEYLLELFFAKSQKLRFWAKIAIFLHVWPNLATMRIFLKK